MKAIVDTFIDKLRAEYASSCANISCGIWSENGNVELRLSYTPVHDGERRTTLFSSPASSARDDKERTRLVASATEYFREVLERSLTVQ